jgi:phosphate transport system ATP-binding protein
VLTATRPDLPADPGPAPASSSVSSSVPSSVPSLSTGAASDPAIAIVSTRGLTVQYADGTVALRDLTLDIRPGEVTVVFGPSRSGKTTLLRVLNRLSELTPGMRISGGVTFRGQDILAPNVDVISLRRRIGMVFAVPTPLPGTIWQNMTYGLRMAGVTDRALLDERVERALVQAALWPEVKDRLDTSAFSLSGGQKQRLCLARSLALAPDVILLDNPTSGLDPISTDIVEESIRAMKSEYVIVLVPHSIQQAARMADRAVFLLGGELVEVAPGPQLFTTPRDQRTEDYLTGRFG